MNTFVLRAHRALVGLGRWVDLGLRYARKHWGLILVWGLGAGFFLAGVLLVWASTLQLPDLSQLQTLKIEQSVKLYDRTGEVLLYNLNKDRQRTVVPLTSISPLIQQSVIAIEDPEFYTHAGVKPTAILRAILTNASQGDLLSGQGGSTITQQVVKLSILTSDKSVARKLKEWVLALKLERAFTKDQILELYLNQVPYGGTMYGAEEAANTFFGKHASDVSLPEAAYMAAVLPAPSRLSPYGFHTDALEVRKNLVLDKMYEHGYITAQERDDAKAAKVTFIPQRDTSIQAPHFVFFVQQYLEEKYGVDALQSNGWKVITSLDADLQVKAEEVAKEKAAYNTKTFDATNIAMVGLDPRNGQILAMVGSRDYFDTEIPGAFNVATAKPGRQPGSAFKPFAYAQAFAEGYTPETVVFDLPTQFSTECKPNDNRNSTPPCYAPQNYDGKFRGPMTLRDALAQSINIPAIKTIYLAGIRDTLQLAKSLGISTLTNPDQYGLTLVLGGGEVTLLEMTSAYGAFAADGMHYDPTPVLRIEDASGRIIEDNSQPVGSQAMDPSVAQKINDVLSDNVARAPLGENDIFSFPGHDVAVKTGTTNDFRDAWTIGYTPNLVIGGWAGNNDNTPMTHKVSGFIIGPAWSQVMRYALTKTDPTPFTRAEYDYSSLKPVLRGVWQTPGSDGRVHDILYWVTKTNPQGPVPSNPGNDYQYDYWEYPVAAMGYSAQAPVQDPAPSPFVPNIDPNTGQPLPMQQYQNPNGGSVIPTF